jgi:hypothetical protein
MLSNHQIARQLGREVCSFHSSANAPAQQKTRCPLCGSGTEVVSSSYSSEWWEVMPGPRKRRGVTHQRRYRAHKLMFDIIFDRWPPAVISIGPRSTDDEPLEWVMFMRAAMFELGKSLRVPVTLFDDDRALALGLGAEAGARGSGLKTLVRRRLPEFCSNKRRVILATATAIAGASRIQRL